MDDSESELGYKEFQELVLAAQVREKRRSGAREFGEIPEHLLAVVEGHHRMRAEAALQCRALLAAAREDLGAAQAAREPQALRVHRIRVVSAYRSLATDRAAWRSAFHTYYDETEDKRLACDGGPHGKDAAELVLSLLRRYKAPPGFSNHTNGEAVDFGTSEGTETYGARKAQRKGWRRTWLYAWLQDRAGTFGFEQLPTEEWHWDYRGAPVANALP